MSQPKGNKKHKDGHTGRPATRTLEPPAKKSSEQVPVGDDSDINEGNDPEQRGKMDDEPPSRKSNRPVEKDQESRSDENTGCAC